MYTGCSDVFRLLVQGGASINEVEYFGDRTTDVITVVWSIHAQYNIDFSFHFAGLSLEKLKSFEQCVAITQLALDNNCTIDSAYEEVKIANPLFWLVTFDVTDAHASAAVHAIDYLYSIGWDLEEKNCLGQTPLLYAAVECKPHTVSCLRALIERGARLDARDKTGQGPLHSALSPPLGLSDWIDLKCTHREEGVLDNNWALNQFFNTEDREHARDYFDTESVLDPLTAPAPLDIIQSTRSLADVEGNQLVDDHEPNVAAEQLTPIGISMSDTESDASPCALESITNPENDDYVHCVDEWGDGHWIRNPSHVLKDCVRTKLKFLLEAGCDPNDLDDDGDSPSDYATHGLWSQWRWALEMTGYVFDEEHDRWIKQTETA